MYIDCHSVGKIKAKGVREECDYALFMVNAGRSSFFREAKVTNSDALSNSNGRIGGVRTYGLILPSLHIKRRGGSGKTFTVNRLAGRFC